MSFRSSTLLLLLRKGHHYSVPLFNYSINQSILVDAGSLTCKRSYSQIFLRGQISPFLTKNCFSFCLTTTKRSKDKNLLVGQDPCRCVHSSGSEEPDNQAQLNKRLPPISPSYTSLIWPKFTNTIRNWFFTYFVIKPYFDADFSVQSFMEGAHEAVSHVSSKLSNGEFDELEGLVEPSLLSELKHRLSSFSVAQQDLLRVATEDIFFSFPYQIGIIIPDSSPDMAKYIESGQKPPPQTRHVEITVVLHVLRGMAEVQRTSKDSSTFSVIDFTKDEENKYRVMVCNYRFFRDFTEGVNPSWIINMVNHFLPAEIQR